MGNIICAVILAIVAIVCFILECRQLNERVFCSIMNIYATKE